MSDAGNSNEASVRADDALASTHTGTTVSNGGLVPAEGMRSFFQVLANTLVANVTTSYLRFALTFWIYLETRSVLATAIIGGSYMLLVAVFGVLFGTLVDRIRKKSVMVLSSTVTLGAYAAAAALFFAFPEQQLIDWRGGLFWVFAGVILVGGVVENLRNIALSTTVTLLVPPEKRDRANGLVGTVQGIAFMVTSVFSGLSVGLLGMGPTVVIAVVATAVAFAHLLFVSIPEKKIVSQGSAGDGFRGIIPAIRAVPGLFAMLIFTTFNNLVGGVFMALMDPYGLTLFPVEIWGVMLGLTSIGFIVGGAAVAKFGLGKNPVRTLLLVNVGVGGIGALFALREWGWLYILGMFVFMSIMPAAEAAEQTIIQRVVPYRAQGRVFGFAASFEAAAAPISSFMVGPIAEFWLIPYMETERGKAAFGWLLGEGEARGMALAFIAASLTMIVLVLLAFRSRSYRRLSAAYADAVPSATGGDVAAERADEGEHGESPAGTPEVQSRAGASEGETDAQPGRQP